MKIAMVLALGMLIGCSESVEEPIYEQGVTADVECWADQSLVGKSRCMATIDYGCENGRGGTGFRIMWDVSSQDAFEAELASYYETLYEERVTGCVGSFGEPYRAACECLIQQEHSCTGVQPDAIDSCGFREVKAQLTSRTP